MEAKGNRTMRFKRQGPGVTEYGREPRASHGLVWASSAGPWSLFYLENGKISQVPRFIEHVYQQHIIIEGELLKKTREVADTRH